MIKLILITMLTLSLNACSTITPIETTIDQDSHTCYEVQYSDTQYLTYMSCPSDRL